MSVDTSIMVPWTGVDFDNSRALPGSPNVPIQLLLIGQKTSSGTGTAAALTRVFDADEVGVLAGKGSISHRQAIKAFSENKTVPTYVIMLDDAATSAAATQLFGITGTATENGEIDFYCNGERFAIGVVAGDTAASLAALIVSTINEDETLPFTVSYQAAPTNTLTFTAKNKGIAAGDMDIRLNYNEGEKVPAGITLTVSTFTAGTVDPDIQDAIDVIGNAWFQVICSHMNDATNLDAIETFLAAQDGSLIMRDGFYYFCRKDTRSGQITFATNANRNSRFVIMIDGKNRPAATFEQSAAVAAVTAVEVNKDPGKPLHRVTVTSIKPVAEGDRYEMTERNQLAQSGIMTLTDDNGVQTEATVTMYLRNSSGAADKSYQYQNTGYILQRLRYSWRNWMSKYDRARLADNADTIEPGITVLTPDGVEAESVAWFLTEQRKGMVENAKTFKANIRAVRPSDNVNRINLLTSPNLMNQLIVMSHTIQFEL